MQTQLLLNNVSNLHKDTIAALQLVAQAQHNNWRASGIPCSMQVHNLEVAAAALKDALTRIAQAAYAVS
jgi:hypothetical protein